MLKNNLSILLTERNIKVLHLSNETGIARSTISKIANNSTDKISMNVINSLCKSLKVTPNEFFSYIPYDFEFHMEDLKEEDFDNPEEYYDIHKPQKYGYDYPIVCYFNVSKFFEKYKTIEFRGCRRWTVDIETNKETNMRISLKISKDDIEGIELFKDISVDFQTAITEQLHKFLIKTDKLVTRKTTVEVDYTVD